MTRTEKIQNFLEKNKIDAVFITSPVSRQYLFDIKSSAGVGVITKDKCFFIIDFRYIELARKTIKNCEIMLQGDIYTQLNEIISTNAIKVMAVEDKTMTLSVFSAYESKLECELLKGTSLSAAIENMRKIKTESELKCIADAQCIADETFSHMLNFIKAGVSERDVAAEIEFKMKKLGSAETAFSTIAVAGKNSSLPHGVPGDYIIANGDFLTMDYGATIDGYRSDMTRTVAIGNVSDEMKTVYDTVLTANKMAIEAIKAGVNCASIDKIARDYIYAAGYEGLFGHGLGHAVGLDIHEEPRFSSLAINDFAEENHVMTVEPGIYLPGKFGVRIEDLLIVKDDGYVNLTKSDKSLICL